MKKILLLSVFIFISAGLFAQERWGIQASLNLASATEKYTPLFSFGEGSGSGSVHYDSRLGFSAGVVAEIPLKRSLSLRPELIFVQKNYFNKVYEGAMDKAIDVNYTQNYLELPVNLIYNEDLRSGRLFLGAGLNFSLGLGGHFKSSAAVYDTMTGERNIDMHLQVFELGLGLLAGYSLSNGIFTSISFNPGIIDFNSDFLTTNFKTSVLHLKVGYMIPSGK